jgi:Tol biopolymer transport system component
MCDPVQIDNRQHLRMRPAYVATLLQTLYVRALSRILLLACCAMLIVACGGGGGGSDDDDDDADNDDVCNTQQQPQAAPNDPIVYAAINSSGAVELCLVDGDAPGVASKLNPALVAGGSVESFALSPDLSQVAYVADQGDDNVSELYLVDLATPGSSTRLNTNFSADRDVTEFAFSPDGASIAYIADQEVNGKFELFLVEIANPGVSTKLNGTLVPADGDVVGGHSFSPDDGTKVLYAADQEDDGLFELYLVDIANPGVSVKVHEDFAATVNLATGFKFSPNGEWIGYMADQDVDGTRELYLVATDTPGDSEKLNGPLVAGGQLCDFEFSPDSTLVAYCAEQDDPLVLELYLVDVSTPGVSMKLNPPLVAGGEVSAQSYRFGPNSDYVIYRADQDTDEVFELYHVDVTTPGTADKVNGALVAGGDVLGAIRTPSFRISPDGLGVSYLADQDTNGQVELYGVALSNPGVPLKLNPPVLGNGIIQLETTDDGLQILYIGLEDSPIMPELYRVALASPGVSTEINAPLPVNGEVIDFAIAPGLHPL